MCQRLLGLLCAGGLLAGVGPAWPGQEPTSGGDRPAETRPASTCPQLFGGLKAHQHNAQVRRQRLDAVDPGAFSINLTHTTDWEPPDRIRYKGLRLLETAQSGDRDRVALVRLEPALAELGCEPGVYRVGVDDSIGPAARVLAVLDDVLLLETGGDLRYLRTQGAERPVFRMIWRSPWKMLRVHGAQAGTAARRPTPQAGKRVTTQRRR